MSEQLPLSQGLKDWAERSVDDLVDAGKVKAATRGVVEIVVQNAIELGIMTERERLLPIPMRLRCPQCHALHLDEGEYATKPHKTHTCQECGEHFQPALVPTVGVKFLPGCKSAP